MSKMRVYEIPVAMNTNLCRLLDHCEYWKKLAGYMGYSAFQVLEIEQDSNHPGQSPTNQLLTQWGYQNHTVEELFMLLHKMQYAPALACIRSVVGEKFQKFYDKRYTSKNVINEMSTKSVDENGNRSTNGNIPILIMEGQKTVPDIENGNSQYFVSDSVDDTTYASSSDITNTDGLSHTLKRHVSAIPKLKYEDLKEATNNWSEANLLGRGGFGQVFKGEWKFLSVAVKRLKDERSKPDEGGRSIKDLISEMCLNQYRHDNILPLYGYSLGGPEACIVYQLMAGGSLEERLRGRSRFGALSWPQRHRIAHGVARGLQFLHTMAKTPLIHGDIKPANILLDQCTIPKIGDFGLARKGPCSGDSTHVIVSKAHGTWPYLPVEYISSHRLSPAVDVYSYGVVMLQLASAAAALDRARPRPLLTDHVRGVAGDGADLAELEDRVLANTPNSNPDLCRKFLQMGLQCASPERERRPSMLDVFRRLCEMEFPGKCID